MLGRGKHITILSLPSANELLKGNVFTSVCQEFCPQLRRHRNSYGWQAGSMHPTEMLSCSICDSPLTNMDKGQLVARS